jgi:hypothetical protein
MGRTNVTVVELGSPRKSLEFGTIAKSLSPFPRGRDELQSVGRDEACVERIIAWLRLMGQSSQIGNYTEF